MKKFGIYITIVFGLSALLSAGGLYADTHEWTGAVSTQWSNAGNWTGLQANWNRISSIPNFRK